MASSSAAIPAHRTPTGATSVFSQGRLKGAAVFGKLEGAWYGNGSIYWSYLSPVGVNPGADGILEALESLSKRRVA